LGSSSISTLIYLHISIEIEVVNAYDFGADTQRHESKGTAVSSRVGINGFGRIGRLALRAAWGWPEFDFALINEIAGDAETAAHLLKFDSIHGRWSGSAEQAEGALLIEGREVAYSAAASPAAVDWAAAGVEVVLECSGRFRTIESLAPYFEQGVRKVVVAAPVKEEGALNVVVGVNDDPAELARHDILTAASCTTNCLAPVSR
jgi:glyceraldehyde 3-phosphate dehydrogenase